MNASQQNAINHIEHFLNGRRSANPEYQDTVSIDVDATSEFGTVFVTANIEMLGLPEGNLLRYVARQYWLFFVGKRGGIEVLMAPKSLDQFNGRRAFGMKFKLSTSKSKRERLCTPMTVGQASVAMSTVL